MTASSRATSLSHQATASSPAFAPFREAEFQYYELQRQLRDSEHSATDRATLLALYQSIRQRLEALGEATLPYLHDLRDDLVLTLPPAQPRHLPRHLFLTLTRNKVKPSHDGALYLALQEEGLEIGFGFGLRRTQHTEHRDKFAATLQRHHRKYDSYTETLRKRDYRLWSEPFQSFHTPSLPPDEWAAAPGVVVRLLERSELSTVGAHLPSLLTQIFGELLGWYGFLDRVYTAIPHIRPLQLESYEDPGSLPPEDDVHEERTGLQSILLDFQSYARSHQLDFPLDLIRTYFLSLQTRPFVILSGMAGTGKSKLALLLARFLTLDTQEGDDNPHVAFLPVRPDWLDPQSLLGYYDTLAHTYRPTPFLLLLLRAHHDPDNPYFVILDEMNLARVEYYLADLLSLLESRVYSGEGEMSQVALSIHPEPDPIHLEDPFGPLLAHPGQFPLPPNLYITGTVNMDETTHRLSPKVLDRANLIEMTSPSPASYLHNLYLNPTPSPEHRSPSTIARQRVAFCRHRAFTTPYRPEQLTLRPEEMAELASSLEAIIGVLAPVGFSVGLRVVQEIVDFGENLARLHAPHPPDVTWWLDHQLLQKILPRLHGSRPLLEPALRQLLLLCWPARNEPQERKRILQHTPEPSFVAAYQERALQAPSPFAPDNTPGPPDLPLSARKIAQMLDAFQHQPYVDFHL